RLRRLVLLIEADPLGNSQEWALALNLSNSHLQRKNAAAQSFVRHRSAEFTVSEPSGKKTTLSALRGKVVVMEFFFLQSNHCTRVAKTLNKLNLELGPRGFQALGVVFDPPNVPESHGEFVGPAVTAFKLTYPIGYSNKADVDSYLGRQQHDVLNIPQIVVI